MATVLDDLRARLPAGYGARPFDDADREPLVAATNAESHPMEAESAREWRRWEAMLRDETTMSAASIQRP